MERLYPKYELVRLVTELQAGAKLQEVIKLTRMGRRARKVIAKA